MYYSKQQNTGLICRLFASSHELVRILDPAPTIGLEVGPFLLARFRISYTLVSFVALTEATLW
jgi:hypothetical protein